MRVNRAGAPNPYTRDGTKAGIERALAKLTDASLCKYQVHVLSTRSTKAERIAHLDGYKQKFSDIAIFLDQCMSWSSQPEGKAFWMRTRDACTAMAAQCKAEVKSIEGGAEQDPNVINIPQIVIGDINRGAGVLPRALGLGEVLIGPNAFHWPEFVGRVPQPAVVPPQPDEGAFEDGDEEGGENPAPDPLARPPRIPEGSIRIEENHFWVRYVPNPMRNNIILPIQRMDFPLVAGTTFTGEQVFFNTHTSRLMCLAGDVYTYEMPIGTKMWLTPAGLYQPDFSQV